MIHACQPVMRFELNRTENRTKHIPVHFAASSVCRVSPSSSTMLAAPYTRTLYQALHRPNRSFACVQLGSPCRLQVTSLAGLALRFRPWSLSPPARGKLLLLRVCVMRCTRKGVCDCSSGVWWRTAGSLVASECHVAYGCAAIQARTAPGASAARRRPFHQSQKAPKSVADDGAVISAPPPREHQQMTAPVVSVHASCVCFVTVPGIAVWNPGLAASHLARCKCRKIIR